MNTRDIRYYDLACEIAALSDCRYKFGSVIAYRNKRISIGINRIKTHPVFRKYGEHCISIHAEMSAILKARCDLTGCTMYIARDSINPHSKPCSVCMSIIIESGISRTVYHNGKRLVEERL